MKLSIITVCYNAADKIEATIKSVINQNSSDYEYIIKDGGSHDNTVDVIKKYNQCLSYWESCQDSGIYDAMNIAVQKARGDYILFLNVGDLLFSKNTIEKCMELMDNNSDLCYGAIVNRMPYGDVLVNPDSIDEIKTRMVFSHQAVFVKRELLSKYKFDIKYKFAADYDFLSKMFFLHYKFQNIGIPIAITPIMEGATYTNKWKSLLEHKDILLKNNTYNEYYFRSLVLRIYIMRVLKSIIPSCVKTKLLKIKNRKRLMNNAEMVFE